MFVLLVIVPGWSTMRASLRSLLLCQPPLLLFFVVLAALPLHLSAQGLVAETPSYSRHDDPQWKNVQQHLPDPATATPKALELQADLLRIRRFPEDALQYYNYAIRRGGGTASLMNKLGLTQLELRNMVLAQGCFRQALKLDRRNAEGWNNLAATEYLARQYAAAVTDYKKAVKLEKTVAVFHANLGTAYFELKNYKNARKEASEALRLDPLVYQHNTGAGIAAHILSVEDRARFQFEMAKIYAAQGQEEEMLHALAVACENGFDIARGMLKEPALEKYVADDRIKLMMLNASALHGGMTPVVNQAAAKLDGSLGQR